MEALRSRGWNIAQRSGRFASASVRLRPSKRFRPRGNHRATRIDFCSGGHLRAVSRQRGRPRARAWDSVNDGSPGELESCIEHYPEGTFAAFARTRLDAAALSPTSPPVRTSGELAAEAH